MSRNVAALVDVPRVESQPVQPFTIEEARAFLASIRGERDEALFITAIMTGLRRGEVLALQWDDVNLPRRFHVPMVPGRGVFVERGTLDVVHVALPPGLDQDIPTELDGDMAHAH